MQTANLIVRKRIATLFFLFTVLLFLLIMRIFWVQFIKGAELSKKAEQNRMRDIPVESKRGKILDRNGNELAISISADSVYAIPAEVKKSARAEEIAANLAPILEMDEAKLLARITKNSSFEWIKRQITPEKAQQIRDLKLPGIDLTEESRRFYPKGTLASHIVGISGTDNTGLEGIDNYYDKLIGGTKGRIIIEHDAVGRDIPEATHKYIPPEDGANIILTIDETIQYITEREIDKVFNEHQAAAAAALVMDPTTGEVLAMVSRPNFDPNDYSSYPAQNRRNFALNDAFEPGSTMKITTAAMAMEEKIVTPDSPFDCPGYIKVGKETIHCSGNKAHGHQTFAQILENSCNVGFVKVGLELGMDKYYKYLTAFGFGKITGIDLPGEAAGIIVNKERAKQIDLATMSMGQANAVTALQLTNAVCATVNGGNLLKPHMVKQVITNQGEIIKTFEPEIITRVISEKTSQELCSILEGEVVNGTGRNAYIEGYRVGGKTGTAQKISPTGGYKTNEYIASFIGVAPSNNPRIVCMVVVDAPKGYPYYGGWVAAPAAREIIRDSLRYLDEPLVEKLEKDIKNDTESNKVLVPDVVNLSVQEAIRNLSARGLIAKTTGEGDTVWQQTPRALSRLNQGSEVILSLSPREKEKEENEITVPDLRGKSMKEVAAILSDLGLHLKPEGTGLAVGQNPIAGKKVTNGSLITVQFQPLTP